MLKLGATKEECTQNSISSILSQTLKFIHCNNIYKSSNSKI